MRLVRYDGGKTGLLVGDGAGASVVDLAPLLPALAGPGPASWRPLIESWQTISGELAEIEQAAPGAQPVSQVKLEPSLPLAGERIFAMGGNFSAHAAGIKGDVKFAAPKLDMPPWGFYVIPGTIIGQDEAVTPPAGTQLLDYEAEVAIVLGPRIADGELDVWGYTGWNDLSIRDAALGVATLDHGPLTWSLQKNFATGHACGPSLVVLGGSLPDDGVSLLCRVNGETRQDGNSNQMNHKFEGIVKYISQWVPLAAGDMILSGTPSGTAVEGGADGPFLRDGDVVEIEIGDAGTLRNGVVWPK